MNIFYLYKTSDSYISIVKLGVGLTKHLKHASVWENKKNAASWEEHIKRKFPDVKLVLAGLTIIEEDSDKIEKKSEDIYNSPNYNNGMGNFDNTIKSTD